MPTARLLLLLAATLAVAACQDRARQLFETAQFEELQNNPEHARELYGRIVRDHPDSELAPRARERLAVLESTPAAPAAP